MSRIATMLGSALDRSGLLSLELSARRRGVMPYKGLTVLCYHRVARPSELGELNPEMIDATPEEFDEQMAYVARNFQPVSVEEVLEAGRGRKPLPAAAALVTFDDGYVDNFQEALPILRKHRIKALFFVATGFIDNRRLFWWERVGLIVSRSRNTSMRLTYPKTEELPLATAADKRKTARRLNLIIKETFDLDLERFLGEAGQAAGVVLGADEEKALGDRALMSWQQVKGLREAGMGVGSHSRNHRVLGTLPLSALATDLAESRATLESHLGEEVRTIAYPVGRAISAAPEVRRVVADAGFELGFTTVPGVNRFLANEDRFDLRRLCVDRGLPTGLVRTWMSFPFLASH